MSQPRIATKTIAAIQSVPRPGEAVWQLIRSGRDVHRMMPGVTCEVLWFATYDLLDEGADAAVRDGLLGLLRTAIGGMAALGAAA